MRVKEKVHAATGVILGRGSTVAPAPMLMTPLLEDVARPIPGENPAGSDVAFGAEFLALRREVEKLNAVDTHVDQKQAAAKLDEQLKSNGRRATKAAASTNGAKPAHSAGFSAEAVIMHARTILRDQSKDVRVVSYLALGLVRRSGLSGVAEAARAIEIVVESFWNVGFPPLGRMAARASALESACTWMTDVVKEKAHATGADRNAIETAIVSIGHIATRANEWDDELITSALAGLAIALEQARAKLRDEAKPHVAKPDERPASATESPKPDDREGVPEQVTATPPQTPAELVSPEAMIVEAARQLREKQPAGGQAYRLLRVYRWDALIQDPAHKGKRTQIAAPSEPERRMFTSLHAASNWAELLELGEEQFAKNPFHFWLDLQKYTVDALEGMGLDYALARDAVIRELQILVTRLPNLPTFTFDDGTRFASPAVATWLEDLGRAMATSGDGAPRPRSVEAIEAEQFAEARTLVDRRDLSGALALLERGSADDASDRQRFQRRAFMTSLALDASEFAVARALLEDLAQIVDRHALAQWEPELAMTVWTRLYACYAGLAARTTRVPELEQLAREKERVFALICRADPVRALATAQEGRRPP